MTPTKKNKFLKLLTATLSVASLAQVGCGSQKFAVEQSSAAFAQEVTYNKQVDVLWVIDTSGSMSSRQAALAEQMPIFIDGLNATGLDYQIGVTTMDMSGTGPRGKLIAQTGTPMILTKNTPNLTSVLAGRLQAGQSGSPTERGREAMMAALNMTATGKSNEGFSRPNALLNVIFLSDESDKSDASVDYVGQLDALKPVLPLGDRSWVAHFIGVVPTDKTCQTAQWGFSSPGVEYISLATTSGGSSESICGADFRQALTNVKSRVLEMLTEFPLDRKPSESTIKVVVDGVTIAKSESNGWTYRASANSVRFHGTAIPKAGARIAVTFDPEGLK